MATKRTASQIHPSRQDQVPAEPRRERRKPDNAGPRSFQKAHPVNELKSEIRSLKRLLERTDRLPADVRVEKERALQTAQHELDQREKAKQRSDMIGKYHKIRFFDRKKASKRLKKARKELQSCKDGEDSRSELSQRVERAEVDFEYPQYYTLDQPYVSLFPRKKDGGSTDGEHHEDDIQPAIVVESQGDPEMWQKVRQCMAEGTLDDLRNGKLIQPDEHANVVSANATIPQSRQRNERRKKADTNKVQTGGDDGSDDGFFE